MSYSKYTLGKLRVTNYTLHIQKLTFSKYPLGTYITRYTSSSSLLVLYHACSARYSASLRRWSALDRSFSPNLSAFSRLAAFRSLLSLAARLVAVKFWVGAMTRCTILTGCTFPPASFGQPPATMFDVWVEGGKRLVFPEALTDFAATVAGRGGSGTQGGLI